MMIFKITVLLRLKYIFMVFDIWMFIAIYINIQLIRSVKLLWIHIKTLLKYYLNSIFSTEHWKLKNCRYIIMYLHVYMPDRFVAVWSKSFGSHPRVVGSILCKPSPPSQHKLQLFNDTVWLFTIHWTFTLNIETILIILCSIHWAIVTTFRPAVFL